MKEKDMVNHPDHYVVGNIIKYITRYPYKGTPLKDLEKARWYLDYLIKQEKNK